MKKAIDVKSIIKNIEEGNNDFIIRELKVADTRIYIVFLAYISDKLRLSSDVIKPILLQEKNVSAKYLYESVIQIEEAELQDDESKIFEDILKGHAVVLIEGDSQYVSVKTLKVEKRAVSAPELETTLRGSKDAFIENFEANLSLIRYRLQDPGFAVEKYSIGRRTKTTVAMMYLEGVVDEKLVLKIQRRLNNIDIDGTVDSAYIQKLLTKGKGFFPQIGIVERSDVACDNILEGKVLLMVDGNNLALVMPKVFMEFFDSGEDHYNSIYMSIFLKSIRFLALIFMLSLSSLYVALIGFNTDILPAPYIISIATARAQVPFNAFVEVILMEIVAELMKEASVRLPKQIGPAIGIVGTIVIGQAAVSAGLVGPLLVIIVALGTMSSFVAPDYTIMNPFRLLKFFLIILTGMFGVFGFTIGLTFIAVHMVSLESFGVPYMSPIAPLKLKDLGSFFASDITVDKTRPDMLNVRNKKRKA